MGDAVKGVRRTRAELLSELTRTVFDVEDRLDRERTLHRQAIQSLEDRLKKTEERAIKEQGRADSAEAALRRAHTALVTAVERLGGR